MYYTVFMETAESENKAIEYVFLILHYLAEEDTSECIESIKKNCNEEKRIIVVDNGSQNDSYKNLSKRYLGDPEVVLLHSDKNLGFAKGNNIGFRYAKYHFSPRFIIMINNDTCIYQKDFLRIINEKYEKYHFAVLGPDIITKDGIHQNPWIRNGFSKTGIVAFRMKQRLRILLTRLGIDDLIFKAIHSNDNRKNKVDGDLTDVPLHGAALVFSDLYISFFDGLDDRTFLYLEEEILKLYCDHYKLKTVYSGDLEIYHKEDVSTKAGTGSNRNKKLFEFKNRIQSSYVYEKIKKELETKRY